jgi:hypothetical protein
MGLKIKFLAVLVGVAFFLLVLSRIKKNTFNPSYSVLWISISLFLISIPVLEGMYVWLAYSAIGLVDARHIIYIALIGFLLIYVFYLTSKITQMSDKIQQLIAFTAILQTEMDDKDSNGR